MRETIPAQSGLFAQMDGPHMPTINAPQHPTTEKPSIDASVCTSAATSVIELTEIEHALFELVNKHQVPDLFDDVRDYMRSGRLNTRLEKRIDADPSARKVMDILFDAQIATIQQVSEAMKQQTRDTQSFDTHKVPDAMI